MSYIRLMFVLVLVFVVYVTFVEELGLLLTPGRRRRQPASASSEATTRPTFTTTGGAPPQLPRPTAEAPSDLSSPRPDPPKKGTHIKPPPKRQSVAAGRRRRVPSATASAADSQRHQVVVGFSRRSPEDAEWANRFEAYRKAMHEVPACITNRGTSKALFADSQPCISEVLDRGRKRLEDWVNVNSTSYPAHIPFAHVYVMHWTPAHDRRKHILTQLQLAGIRNASIVTAFDAETLTAEESSCLYAQSALRAHFDPTTRPTARESLTKVQRTEEERQRRLKERRAAVLRRKEAKQRRTPAPYTVSRRGGASKPPLQGGRGQPTAQSPSHSRKLLSKVTDTVSPSGTFVSFAEESLAIKHYTALYDMVQRNIPAALILEDDAVLPTDFLSRVTALFQRAPTDWQRDWDVVHLNTCDDFASHLNIELRRRMGKDALFVVDRANAEQRSVLDQMFPSGLVPMERHAGNAAFLVSRKGAMTLLSYLPFSRPVDEEWATVYRSIHLSCKDPARMRVYWMLEPIASCVPKREQASTIIDRWNWRQ